MDQGSLPGTHPTDISICEPRDRPLWCTFSSPVPERKVGRLQKDRPDVRSTLWKVGHFPFFFRPPPGVDDGDRNIVTSQKTTTKKKKLMAFNSPLSLWSITEVLGNVNLLHENFLRELNNKKPPTSIVISYNKDILKDSKDTVNETK